MNKSFGVKGGSSNSNLYSQGLENTENWANSCYSTRSKVDQLEGKGAEDFYVPAGHFWRIKQVYAPGWTEGFYPGDPFQINIYADTNGVPGKMIFSRVASNINVGSPNLDLVLPTPVTLSAGHYWLSIQLNMLTASYVGAWYWQGASISSINQPGKIMLIGFGNHFPSSWFDVPISIDCAFNEYVFSMGGIDGTYATVG